MYEAAAVGFFLVIIDRFFIAFLCSSLFPKGLKIKVIIVFVPWHAASCVWKSIIVGGLGWSVRTLRSCLGYLVTVQYFASRMYEVGIEKRIITSPLILKAGFIIGLL